MALILAVLHNGARVQFDTTPQEAWSRLGAERNDGPTGDISRMLDSAECLIRARSSECRCIHRRCRSIRMSFAVKRPRPVTVSSALVARVDAAYSSGSEKVRTALEGISTSRWGSTMH